MHLAAGLLLISSQASSLYTEPDGRWRKAAHLWFDYILCRQYVPFVAEVMVFSF